jgi:hypothetical protein
MRLSFAYKIHLSIVVIRYRIRMIANDLLEK